MLFISNVIFLPRHKRYQRLQICSTARHPYPLMLWSQATQAWRLNTVRRAEGERGSHRRPLLMKRQVVTWDTGDGLTEDGETRTSSWLYCSAVVTVWIIFEFRLAGNFPLQWFCTSLCGAQLICGVKIQFTPTLPKGLVVCFGSYRGKKTHPLHLFPMVKHVNTDQTLLA